MARAAKGQVIKLLLATKERGPWAESTKKSEKAVWRKVEQNDIVFCLRYFALLGHQTFWEGKTGVPSFFAKTDGIITGTLTPTPLLLVLKRTLKNAFEFIAG
ncbi:hypothetical protein CEXT_493781 [Caerostris extrusa]|uniref:Uncharacterized protein n=1 Tax=Caerostris extrusa TaxID=172846 RepID=A0AAV4SZR9_CAEEX|nr:hypothetical protein CEXT_493781 [Caerostris extrusa]